jgi:hypothetical protein
MITWALTTHGGHERSDCGAAASRTEALGDALIAQAAAQVESSKGAAARRARPRRCAAAGKCPLNVPNPDASSRQTKRIIWGIRTAVRPQRPHRYLDVTSMLRREQQRVIDIGWTVGWPNIYLDLKCPRAQQPGHD